MSVTDTAPWEDADFRCAQELLADMRKVLATISASGTRKYRMRTIGSARAGRVASRTKLLSGQFDLTVQEFSNDRADHAQAEDGDGAVVLLKSNRNVCILRIHVGSPAKPAKDADTSHGTQHQAASVARL